jgi:hypothetical protein
MKKLGLNKNSGFVAGQRFRLGINKLPRRKRTGYPSKDSFFIAASGGE